MIRLIVSYFEDSNAARQAEIDRCLKVNSELSAIDEIILLLEYPCNVPVKAGKIKQLLIHDRPTFNNIFGIVNTLTGDDINIIANSDIYFDETILLASNMGHNACYALTRWDWFDSGNSFTDPKFLNRQDSQDVWIMRGKVKHGSFDFWMGVPGCDNAIAYWLAAAGYVVTNPSLSIKAYHLHSGTDRTYDVNKRVPQPYKLLNPSSL